jgi:hypothetical protein
MEFLIEAAVGLAELLAWLASLFTPNRGWPNSQAIGCMVMLAALCLSTAAITAAAYIILTAGWTAAR